MSDRDRWQERHHARPVRAAPSAFVAAHVERLASRWRGARALDVACGSGRHALLLSQHGFDTVALDQASAACHRVARELPAVRALVADATALPLRAASFAVIVQTRYLERAIVRDLLELLVHGGVLLVETFLITQHAATGHPRREFCLEPGELARLCRGANVPIEVLDVREGLVASEGEAAHLAAIAVCKV